jgi:hypothetical protein
MDLQALKCSLNIKLPQTNFLNELLGIIHNEAPIKISESERKILNIMNEDGLSTTRVYVDAITRQEVFNTLWISLLWIYEL